MRRIAPKTIWTASSTPNTSPTGPTEQKVPVRILKPAFSEGIPCYDPYESHVHVWKPGYRIPNLKAAEDPKKPTYSRVPVKKWMLAFQFCSVCHKEKKAHSLRPHNWQQLETLVDRRCIEIHTEKRKTKPETKKVQPKSWRRMSNPRVKTLRLKRPWLMKEPNDFQGVDFGTAFISTKLQGIVL